MQSLCSGKYLRTLVFLGLSAAPFQWVSAQFNLSLSNPKLGSVIKEIQAQSDYQFFYDDKLASVQLESLNVTDSSLQEVLSKALSGKNISYKIDDKSFICLWIIPQLRSRLHRMLQRRRLPDV